ncbi:chemotaxis protein CheB [Endozoicomonadaceae bacterium StTr2]
MSRYKAVVIGASAGGFELLVNLLEALPESFPLPVLVVIHTASSGNTLSQALAKAASLSVVEGVDKQTIQQGRIVVAPGGYHMLVEDDGYISLCVGERVCHSRPSIDVLFESAADVYGDKLIGVILSGANRDGANGMKYLCDQGGLPVVQDPATAVSPVMPKAVLKQCDVEHIVKPEEIPELLVQLAQ